MLGGWILALWTSCGSVFIRGVYFNYGGWWGETIKGFAQSDTKTGREEGGSVDG